MNREAALDYEHVALAVRRLGTSRSTAEIARIAVSVSVALAGADAGLVAAADGAAWRIVEHTGFADIAQARDAIELAIGAVDALRSGEMFDVPDVDAATSQLRRLAVDIDIASALLIPLMVEGSCDAVLVLGRHARQPFNDRDRALLGIVAAQIGARMRELRANERSRAALDALRANERIVREQLQRKARTVDVLQHIYIPHVLPAVPGLRFDALYVPADDEARVGGDWYDAFLMDDGRLVFSVGDVAGHGLDAAVTMGLIRQTIFASAFYATSAGDVLVSINRTLLAQRLGIATAIVGIYDPATGTVEYAGAGHPPALLARASGVELLEYGGIPLGIEPVDAYANAYLTLGDEDVLVLYTDALIEHGRDIVHGSARLIDVVGACREHPDRESNFATMVANRVLQGMTADDDLAVLTLRVSDSAHRRGLSSIQTRSDTIAWDFHYSTLEALTSVRAQFVRFITPLVTESDGVMAAELVLGELLTNAVEHAPGELRVELDWDDVTPTLTVRDRGRGGVGPGMLPDDPLAESGRGMFLVAALTKNVAVRRCDDGGTEVVVWLDLLRNESVNDE